MRKIFKKVTFAFTAALMTVGLVACGGPKVPPTEVASLYLDAILYQKFDELNAHTGLNETSKDFYEEFNKGITAGLGDVTIDEDMQNQVFEALLTAIGHVTYEVVGEEITKDTAVVTISVNGINFDDILSNVQKDLVDVLSSGTLPNEEDVPNIVLTSMVKHLKNATPIETPKESTLTLDKIGNKWGIADESNLESFLTETVIISSMM